MKIVVTGPAGAGKGSLARMISADYKIPHISTGELFREQIKAKTEVGKIADEYISKGRLVPDDIAVKLLLERIEKDDCQNGFILDGFPRTVNQARLLSEHIMIDYLIEIETTAQTVLIRLGGRYMCKTCGQIHNRRWDSVEKCKDCGGELYQRTDDTEGVILRRLDQYHLDTKPIISYYLQECGITILDRRYGAMIGTRYGKKNRRKTKRSKGWTQILNLQSRLEYSAEDMYKVFGEKYGKLFVKQKTA